MIGLRSLAAALALCLSGAAHAETYRFSQAAGNLNASGTITTNINSGALSAANITAYQITVTNGLSSATFSQANNAAVFSGNALTATSSGLFFNFSAPGVNYALFGPNNYSSFFCWQTSGCYDPNVAGAGERLNNGTDQTVALTGNRQVASVVPEPVTWGLMVLGFGAAGAASRRRKVRSIATA